MVMRVALTLAGGRANSMLSEASCLHLVRRLVMANRVSGTLLLSTVLWQGPIVGRLDGLSSSLGLLGVLGDIMAS